MIQLTVLAEMRKQPRPLQYRKLEPRTINAAEAVTLPAQSSDIESAPTTPKSSDPIENWQSLSQHMARSRDPLRPLGDGEAEEEEGMEEEEDMEGGEAGSDASDDEEEIDDNASFASVDALDGAHSPTAHLPSN